MLAAMHGKIDCVLKLLQASANVSKTFQLLSCPASEFFLSRLCIILMHVTL
jgi:hypothetical protein